MNEAPKDLDGKRSTVKILGQEASQGIGWLTTGVKTVLGIVPVQTALPGSTASDAGTMLAVERTQLALDRSYLAAERTLMAWIRTALSMISFGFTIGKLGQALSTVEVKKLVGDSMMSISVQSLAYFLVVLGTSVMIGSSIQFRLRTNELKRIGLARRFSMAFYVAILLAVVGGGALSALVMEL